MPERPLTFVAVTGAAGFIGSHLVERLVNDGVHVRALVHANANCGIGNLSALPPDILGKLDIRFIDILDVNNVKAAVQSVDTVFHLAANISIPYSTEAPMLFLQTNVIGTYNILQAIREMKETRTVIISSSEVYGKASGNPLREDHEMCACSPYAATKIAAEKLAESYYHSYDADVVIVRPFNTYGPRQSPRAVIPWIINQALESSDIKLGNVFPVRDFLFVRDNVAGMIAAATANDVQGQSFNLATGAGISVEDLVHKIGSLMGRSLTIHTSASRTRTANSEVWERIGDTEKARTKLGWSPKVGLDEGLMLVINAARSSTPVAAAERYQAVATGNTI
jgi:nucleoside-diphosphate-sugar epimerase